MLWLALLLPLSTPLLLTTLNRSAAMTLTPLLLYSVGLMLLAAAWVGASDGWLGLFVGWHALALLWSPTVEAFETVEILALSALGLAAVRRLPADRRETARWLLIGLGIFQVLYGALQLAGYDVLWWGIARVRPVDGVPGTLGNRGYYGLYLAMLAPLAPGLLLPLFAAGVLGSQSFLAVLALAGGVGWRYRADVRPVAWAAAAGAALAALAVWRGPAWPAGLAARLDIWGYALAHMHGWDWMIGHGPGAWSALVPAAQIAAGAAVGETFFHAHNEWVQALFEGGAVALVLLGGWLWRHRAGFAGPYGGAWVALLIGSLGHFGFRMAITGGTALVLIGLGRPQSEGDRP